MDSWTLFTLSSNTQDSLCISLCRENLYLETADASYKWPSKLVFQFQNGRTSNIYFTVYSHKTAEVGCLLLYTVKCIFVWTFVAWLLLNWSLQSAGYRMSFVVCHPVSITLSGLQKHETFSTNFSLSFDIVMLLQAHWLLYHQHV